MSLVQVLVPFQHGVQLATDAVTPVHPDDVPRDPGEMAAVVRERAALRNQVASLEVRVADLESENRLLSGTRLWSVEGERIGAQGRLIPGRVVTSDLLAWRASQLLNIGRLSGVGAGDAVVSGHFWIDRGEDAALRGGLAVLLAETLVGFVEEVGSHTSRVKLLSDPTVEMKVRVGRFVGEAFEAEAQAFWLVGRGQGLMEIREVDQRDVERGVIRTGDTVLSDPFSTNLPAAMVIGSVADAVPDRARPLLVNLTVSPAVEPSALRRVYVFDPQRSEP